MGRIRKFFAMAAPRRRLFVEAVFWLALARAAIVLLPFRWIARRLGRHMAESPNVAMPERTLLLREISRTLRIAARNMPWECKCLVQAVAGQAMLRRRGLASTLYLGVAKEGEVELKAHAWLRCGDVILTGGRGRARYTVVSTFAEEAE